MLSYVGKKIWFFNIDGKGNRLNLIKVLSKKKINSELMALPWFTPCFNLTVSWEMEIWEVYQKGKKQKFLSYCTLKISSDINDLED